MARGPLGRTLTWVAVTLIAIFFLQLFYTYYYLQQKEETPTSTPLTSPQAVTSTDLYACKIEDPLALNALSRVRTESCRLKLTEAACKLKNNLFHDTFPASTCSNHDSLRASTHVGCYSDSSKNRTLTGFQYIFKSDNSIDKCQTYCYRAGFVYFGLEYGYECYCGNEANASPIPPANCSAYTCPGDSSTFCGGFNAVDVYRTGLKKESINPKAKYVEVVEAPSSPPAVKIMFLLQLNGRNDRQVKRMLKAIYSPHHLYYIHVDQRQLYMLTEMKAVAALLPNVYVAPDGHSTIWGGASLLQMVQDAIRRSLTMPEFSTWDYLINMSESDFPVLSMKELEAQLATNKGKTFLASHGYNTARFIQKQGFDFVFMECEERMWRIAKRNEFPKHLRLDGGSDWLVLHREFAEFSVSNDELPAKMRKLFASIILPVESFFHTLAYNSPFCETIISSHLRLTNWNRKQGCRCASLKKVVDWCGCSPLVFKSGHASKYSINKVQEKAQYIARKFESLIDIDAIAIAESQAFRFRPDLLKVDHPSFNSTFVNFYKADIDGYSLPNLMLATAISKMAHPEVKIISLLRIDTYKANSNANHQMVFTVKTSEGRSQYLVQRILRGKIISPAINDGYELMVAHYGVNIDHKEEIFRGITGYTDMSGNPTIALRWSRVPSLNKTADDNKTSPATKLTWINSVGATVSSQTVAPYDSIYGTQFASLDLSSLDEGNRRPGMWTVLVSDEKTTIAKVSFPVFDTNDATMFEKMAKDFYVVRAFCSRDCESTTWSITFPDPKSDILYGYDSSLDFLV